MKNVNWKQETYISHWASFTNSFLFYSNITSSSIFRRIYTPQILIGVYLMVWPTVDIYINKLILDLYWLFRHSIRMNYIFINNVLRIILYIFFAFNFVFINNFGSSLSYNLIWVTRGYLKNWVYLSSCSEEDKKHSYR